MIKEKKQRKEVRPLLPQSKIDRINELAHKKKAEGLTREETVEQRGLREEFLLDFRRRFRAQLDNLDIEYVEDAAEGARTPSKN